MGGICLHLDSPMPQPSPFPTLGFRFLICALKASWPTVSEGFQQQTTCELALTGVMAWTYFLAHGLYNNRQWA